MKALWAALAMLLAASTLAAAPEQSPEQLFKAAVTALEREAWDEAIDQLELLADRGYAHPDASFNRAHAYVQRARSPAARPGDLGRAAAALAETLEQRPDDSEAEAALERIQSEIARRRARDSAEPITSRPSFARAVTSLLSETAWAIGALVGSLALTAGLAFMYSPRRRRRLAARITASVGALVLVIAGGLTLAARSYRLGSEPAVVVAPDARMLDEQGAALAGTPRDPKTIPEGSSVYVLERRGRLARVEWGTLVAWVDIGQIRILARR